MYSLLLPEEKWFQDIPVYAGDCLSIADECSEYKYIRWENCAFTLFRGLDYVCVECVSFTFICQKWLFVINFKNIS